MHRLLPSAALVLCLSPALASASESSPATEACKTLGEGDACTMKEPKKGPDGLTYEDISGTCQPDECCEQDYSKGSPPELVCGPCLACKPDEGASLVSPEPTAGEAPRAGDEPPAAGGSKRGCTAGGDAPWTSLLWLLPLVALRRRR